MRAIFRQLKRSAGTSSRHKLRLCVDFVLPLKSRSAFCLDTRTDFGLGHKAMSCDLVHSRQSFVKVMEPVGPNMFQAALCGLKFVFRDSRKLTHWFLQIQTITFGSCGESYTFFCTWSLYESFFEITKLISAVLK